jgi:hypothetical protein
VCYIFCSSIHFSLFLHLHSSLCLPLLLPSHLQAATGDDIDEPDIPPQLEPPAPPSSDEHIPPQSDQDPPAPLPSSEQPSHDNDVDPSHGVDGGEGMETDL